MPQDGACVVADVLQGEGELGVGGHLVEGGSALGADHDVEQVTRKLRERPFLAAFFLEGAELAEYLLLEERMRRCSLIRDGFNDAAAAHVVGEAREGVSCLQVGLRACDIVAAHDVVQGL